MLKPAARVESSFVHRFESVRTAVLRMRIVQGVGWSLLIASGSVTALAAVDYAWELAWGVRAMGLAVTVGLALAVAAVGILRPLLWWSRTRTAKELEAAFPQLGQRNSSSRSDITPHSWLGLCLYTVTQGGYQSSLVVTGLGWPGGKTPPITRCARSKPRRACPLFGAVSMQVQEGGRIAPGRASGGRVRDPGSFPDPCGILHGTAVVCIQRLWHTSRRSVNSLIGSCCGKSDFFYKAKQAC